MPRATVIAAGLALCVAAGACTQQSPPDADQPPAADTGGQSTVDTGPALDTEEQKTLYTIGQVFAESIGGNLEQLDLSESETELVVAGLNDALRGRESRVDIETYGPTIEAFAMARIDRQVGAERDASAAYVERQAQEPGAQRNESGSIFIPVTAGTGESPEATDTVRVHYHGTLRDGAVFDSSRERGEPAEFPLNGVIPCWTENVQKMQVGGTAKLVCPASTAYGDRGPPGIPGGAALTFEVELLEIVE